jgi:hypothetical protein
MRTFVASAWAAIWPNIHLSLSLDRYLGSHKSAGCLSFVRRWSRPAAARW